MTLNIAESVLRLLFFHRSRGRVFSKGCRVHFVNAEDSKGLTDVLRSGHLLLPYSRTRCRRKISQRVRRFGTSAQRGRRLPNWHYVHVADVQRESKVLGSTPWPLWATAFSHAVIRLPPSSRRESDPGRRGRKYNDGRACRREVVLTRSHAAKRMDGNLNILRPPELRSRASAGVQAQGYCSKERDLYLWKFR